MGDLDWCIVGLMILSGFLVQHDAQKRISMLERQVQVLQHELGIYQ